MSNNIFKQIQPFFLAGVTVVVSIVVLAFLFHIIVAALVVGTILYAISWLLKKFCPDVEVKPKSKRKPVTYEHGEY